MPIWWEISVGQKLSDDLNDDELGTGSERGIKKIMVVRFFYSIDFIKKYSEVVCWSFLVHIIGQGMEE